MGATREQIKIKKLEAELEIKTKMVGSLDQELKNFQDLSRNLQKQIRGHNYGTEIKKAYCRHLESMYGPDWAKATTWDNFNTGLKIFVAGVNFNKDNHLTVKQFDDTVEMLRNE